jgi:putative membrane protein insertion efficiency factor
VSSCRYYPSCSNYAMEAFSVHGFGRAFGLTARRLVRCRPFGPHGIDLVPLPESADAAVAHQCEAGNGHHSGAREVHQPC